MRASFRRRFFRHRFLGQEKKLHLWYFRTIRKLTKVVSWIIESAVRKKREKKGWIFKSAQQICQLGFNCRNCLQKDATDKSEERGQQNYTSAVYLNLNLVYGKKDTTQSPSDLAYSRRRGLHNKVYTGRLRSEVRHFTLIHTIYDKKGIPFRTPSIHK